MCVRSGKSGIAALGKSEICSQEYFPCDFKLPETDALSEDEGTNMEIHLLGTPSRSEAAVVSGVEAS